MARNRPSRLVVGLIALSAAPIFTSSSDMPTEKPIRRNPPNASTVVLMSRPSCFARAMVLLSSAFPFDVVLPASKENDSEARSRNAAAWPTFTPMPIAAAPAAARATARAFATAAAACPRAENRPSEAPPRSAPWLTWANPWLAPAPMPRSCELSRPTPASVPRIELRIRLMARTIRPAGPEAASMSLTSYFAMGSYFFVKIAR